MYKCSTWNAANLISCHTLLMPAQRTYRLISCKSKSTGAESRAVSQTIQLDLSAFHRRYRVKTVRRDTPTSHIPQAYSLRRATPLEIGSVIPTHPMVADAVPRMRQSRDGSAVIVVPCVPALRMVDVNILSCLVCPSESSRCGSYIQNFIPPAVPAAVGNPDCAVRHLPCSTPRH